LSWHSIVYLNESIPQCNKQTVFLKRMKFDCSNSSIFKFRSPQNLLWIHVITKQSPYLNPTFFWNSSNHGLTWLPEAKSFGLSEFKLKQSISAAVSSLDSVIETSIFVPLEMTFVLSLPYFMLVFLTSVFLVRMMVLRIQRRRNSEQNTTRIEDSLQGLNQGPSRSKIKRKAFLRGGLNPSKDTSSIKDSTQRADKGRRITRILNKVKIVFFV